MRKISFLAMITMMFLLLFSCICFANQNNDTSDVNYDINSPKVGLNFHSWMTGVGSTTMAHTQVIDSATGKVIKQLDTLCGYEDTPVLDSPQSQGNN